MAKALPRQTSQASEAQTSKAVPAPSLSPGGTFVPPSKDEAERSREQIARRAFEIFQARGQQPGDAEADWLQAERELSLRRD